MKVLNDTAGVSGRATSLNTAFIVIAMRALLVTRKDSTIRDRRWILNQLWGQGLDRRRPRAY